MAEKKSSLFASFGYAWRGCLLLFGSERNARIQLGLIVFAVLAGLGVGLTTVEWSIVAISSAAVIAAEAFNTAIEHLCNHLYPEKHPAIRNVKDLSAAAVLIISAAALVSIGFLLFPRILMLVFYPASV
ncbi:MAG: diacylglycerol kinase family protein [Bacteroidetes bacterium]|nr:diacylglycerol kinase family protein [Bacteroidota bacterium]